MIRSSGSPRWAHSANGARIAYEVEGAGPVALILVHGWCCHRGFWSRQVEHFRGHYSVVSLDLGGHGQSSLDRERWSMEAFGQDVVAVVEAVSPLRAVLVGHSMAGSVVAEAAWRLGEQLLAVVGVETFWDLLAESSPVASRSALGPFLRDYPKAHTEYVRSMFLPSADPEMVDEIQTAMAVAPTAVGIGALEAVLASREALRRNLEELHRRDIPVALINSSDWRPTNTAGTDAYGLSVRTLAGTGHFPMLEDAPAFNRLLEKTLDSLLSLDRLG